MPLIADVPWNIAGQVSAAVVLASLGVFLLLPRPRGRSIAAGLFLCVAAVAVVTAFVLNTFGPPAPDLLGQILFWFFSAGAVLFAVVLVAQRNPARGAMAFAFVILCTTGLFLLLAAPFLMAATIIIYAGAIIVTFLFVLMLSHAKGPSDENDRSREPLLGSLAGFAFVGLLLFTLMLSRTPAGEPDAIPFPLVPGDRTQIVSLLADFQAADQATTPQELEPIANKIHLGLCHLVGLAPGEVAPVDPPEAIEPTTWLPIQTRLQLGDADVRVQLILEQANQLRDRKKTVFAKIENDRLGGRLDLAQTKVALQSLRDEVRLLAGRGELPARNVAAIGYLLYSEHLLAVEMAGTLLLVATIGAVAIAQRKAVAA